MPQGEEVPIPRRSVLSSHKKLALSWARFEEESTKRTEPEVPPETAPPMDIAPPVMQSPVGPLKQPPVKVMPLAEVMPETEVDPKTAPMLVARIEPPVTVMPDWVDRPPAVEMEMPPR